MGSVSVLNIVYGVVLTFVCFPERTASAPADISLLKHIGTFSGDLLQYTKNHSCVFPIRSELEESDSSVFKKLDYLCKSNATTGRKSSPGQSADVPITKAPSSIESLCVGIAQAVERICNATNKNIANEDWKKDLDLSLKIDTEAPKTNSSIFCEGLIKNGPKKMDLSGNIQGFYDNFLVNVKGEDDIHCASVCKNKPVQSIKGDDKSIINPLCLVFKKAYQVLKAAETIQSKIELPTKEVIADVGDQKPDIFSMDKKKDPKQPVIPKPNDDSDKEAESADIPFSDSNKSGNKLQTGGNSENSDKPTEVKQDASLPGLSIDTVSGKPNPISNSDLLGTNSDGQNPEPIVAKDKSSTTSTTTTTASAGGSLARENGELPPPPLQAVDDVKSSSPKSKTEDKKPILSSKKPSGSSEKTKVEKPDLMDGAGGEVDEYTDAIDGIPPPVISNNDIGNNGAVDSVEDDININMDSPLDKPQKKPDILSFSESKLPSDDSELGSVQIDKGQGRTVNINVYSDDESGGFFNYFLFFITFMGLGFLLFHNKRRLLAYVVEGRNPRGSRTRRRSSSSASGPSYRKLENNFE